MVCQFPGIDCDVCGIVLNVLDGLSDICRVLSDACIMAFKFDIKAIKTGILCSVLGLQCGNIAVVAGNLPLQVLVLGMKVCKFGGMLGGGGLHLVNFRLGSRNTLCKIIDPRVVFGDGVFHLGVVLVVLGNFFPKLGVVGRKARDLRRKVFYLVAVLFDLCIVCTGLCPIPLVGDIDTGGDVAPAGIALVGMGDDSQRFIAFVNIPFQRVGKNRHIPTADVLRWGALRSKRRARRSGRARRVRVTTAWCKGCGFDGVRVTMLVFTTHSVYLLSNK